jgi:acyl carrier protein
VTGLPAGERLRAIRQDVADQVRAALGHAAATQLSAGQSFDGLGMDSMTALDLRSRLASVTGLPLPATVALDYPTISALADYLMEQAAPESAARDVLDQLAQLEHDVAELVADAPERLLLGRGLRALAAAVTGRTGGASTAADAAVTDRLAAASDEELFGLLDTQSAHSLPGIRAHPEESDI